MYVEIFVFDHGKKLEKRMIKSYLGKSKDFKIEIHKKVRPLRLMQFIRISYLAKFHFCIDLFTEHYTEFQ